MKSTKLILATLVVSLCGIFSANAQFRIGPKVGITVNSLHFNNEVFNKENRAGFTGGLMMEFTAPIIGVGFDLSAMYVRRDARWMEAQQTREDNRDYIEIPLNLKWKLNIPLINAIVRPYLTTGPSVAFLTSRRAISDAYRNKSVDTAWNFGFGAELLRHLQIGASYGIGLTKALESVGATGSADIDGKNRYWTVTATYLF